jgi:hypothetical protein
LLILSCFLFAQQASAHVLVMDSTNTQGAILHIIPDDDPVAGEVSQLYFDMQQTNDTVREVRLVIRDEAGAESSVDTTVKGALVTASYIFPAQGAYEIRYTVIEDRNEYVFTQAQRVSRGIVSSALNTPNYSWAQALLIASGVGLVILGILVWNHRKDIAKHSTF